MNRWFLAFPILLFAVLVFRPAPALAGLHICNKTEHRVSVAIGILSGDCILESCDSSSKGWWQIEPDSCKTPIGADLDTSGDTDYYYYAEDSDGGTWTGDVSLCIDPENAFDFGDNDQTNCSGTHKSFRRIATDKASDFTLNLTP